MSRGTLRRTAALVLLTVAPAAAGATVLMHLKLERSEPSTNGVLRASPTHVRLWFTQKPELSVTSIKVRTGTGKGAVERALAPLSRADSANAAIVAPVGAALAPGHYEVVWRTMARDGHVLNGVISFDVRPAR
ncbi:MAG TPA: copper resistance protein CopC [Gemmatimonadaceae bacterium]|nr:copper resistance protein CopC [Gemmatimonadaceae bacterium]